MCVCMGEQISDHSTGPAPFLGDEGRKRGIKEIRSELAEPHSLTQNAHISAPGTKISPLLSGATQLAWYKETNCSVL